MTNSSSKDRAEQALADYESICSATELMGGGATELLRHVNPGLSNDELHQRARQMYHELGTQSVQIAMLDRIFAMLITIEKKLCRYVKD